jgi:lysophospholipase L1-like esterase
MGYDAIFSKPNSDGQKILATIDDRGDVIPNRREFQTKVQRLKLDRIVPIKNMEFQQEAVVPITDFIRWCQNNGIDIIAGYPALMDFPEYHSGVKQAFFQALGNYYHSLGVPTLGEPSDFMFPKAMFFDSDYHMHDEGAAVMTNLVAQRLKPIFAKSRDFGGYIPSESH